MQSLCFRDLSVALSARPKVRGAQVLDGPNFAVAWMEQGVLKAPSWRELGMLESITCRLALEAAARAGVPIDEGVAAAERKTERGDDHFCGVGIIWRRPLRGFWKYAGTDGFFYRKVHRLSDLERADEVWIASTSADLLPVSRVGDVEIAVTPDSDARRAISAAMAELALEAAD